MKTLQPVRGTHDLLPHEQKKYSFITQTAKDIAASYGFFEMATPIMEFKEVFQRTLGDVSDIVTKEMYEIADRGNEEIVLRPEGTAAIARAVLSNGLTQALPLKYFYQGPMFRYERPQKGRLRQLHQFGIELFGVADPLGDVEVLSIAYEILKALGLEKHITLEINTLGDKESRDVYRRELVSFLKDYRSSLSSDSQQRLERNPLRILDSKDEADKKILENAPLLNEHLNPASQEIFAKVLEGLDFLKIPYKTNPHLVRGLDYYCHVAFEFTTTELGAQGTILAGGRYDGLIEMMGGPAIPGVGWAAGIDRIAMMLTDKAIPQSSRPIAIIPTDAMYGFEGLKLADKLHKMGIMAEMTYEGNLGKRFKRASKMNASHALIIGEEELKNQTVTLKNMDTGDQVTISPDNITDYLS